MNINTDDDIIIFIIFLLYLQKTTVYNYLKKNPTNIN